MKRFLIALLIVVILVPLIIGGMLWYSYNSITLTSLPTVTVVANDTTVPPNGYEWNVPVLRGMMQKQLTQSTSLEATPIGTLTSTSFALTPPEGYATQFTLTRDDTILWQGTAEEWQQYTIPGNGTYVMQATAQQPFVKGNQAYGSFWFRFSFTVQQEPTLTTSSTSVPQGDVLAIQVKNLPQGTLPILESDLVTTAFVQTGEGEACAWVPTSYYTEDGSYSLTVHVGEKTWDIPFTVEWVGFPRQDLQIDTSDPVISEANSQAAYDEYNRTIPPLFDVGDKEKHWQGSFTKPVGGRYSTEYGFRRYTNGSPASRPHAGLDIAADENTPVLAPAAGRVLYADYLLNTGYTLVIEHGNGLKSLYYHMNGLTVSKGDMVTQGQQVGLVGSTGYSTGPHLHFDVRIYNVSINPDLLFNPDSPLFTYEK